MDDREKLEQITLLYNNRVRRNITVVTPEDLGVKYLLRLDENKIKIFTPWISKSQGDSEDRTVPRVVTSPYILGCFIAVPFNLNGAPPFLAVRTGLYIHAFEFKAALKVNEKLVFDADQTAETWLVPYDDKTRVFKPILAGSLLVNRYIVIPSDKYKNNSYKIIVNLYIHVAIEDGLPFNRKIFLEKGYHSLEFNFNYTETLLSETTLDSGRKEVKVTKIDAREFNKERDNRTFISLESLVKKNTFLNW